MKRDCTHRRQHVALLAGDELPAWRAARVQRHVERCAACARDLRELRELRDLAPALAPANDGFLSVQQAVLDTIGTAPATGRARTPLEAVWAPVLGVLAVAAILVLGGRPDAGPADGTARDGQVLTVNMSYQGDSLAVPVPVGRATRSETRLVAVSTRSDDFGDARFFQVQGDTWSDPMPDPAAGQAYFYRVD